MSPFSKRLGRREAKPDELSDAFWARWARASVMLGDASRSIPDAIQRYVDAHGDGEREL